MSSLSQLLEIPAGNMILLVGSPGSGKSTFCHQTVLSGIGMKPVIYVTTETAPSKVLDSLRQKGLSEVLPHSLGFVDAFHETVGLSTVDRPDTVDASSADLTSLGIAISKLQERAGENVLLVFDSLTSPYLMTGPEAIRFMRLTLSRSAAEGNAVLACMDEGCSKDEDLVAMMSTADGIVKIKLLDDVKTFSILKHPLMKPTKMEVSVTTPPHVVSAYYDIEYVKKMAEMSALGFNVTLRPEMGDYVNIAWRNLVFWSGMLWDPKRFPMMMYELTKYSEDPSNYEFDMVSVFPWYKRLLLKLFMPKSFSPVKDMKKIIEGFGKIKSQCEQLRTSTVEYLDDISKMDEHYLRFSEHYECWGFENVEASLGFMKSAMLAGSFQGMEKLLEGPEREWNAVETKCLGLGDPYCEVKFVPGKIDGLKDSLEKDNVVIERVYERLIDYILGFLLDEKPLMERSILGGSVHIHEIQHVTAAPLASERLQMVFSMGGARAGKMLGDHLLESGISKEKAVERIVNLMEHCKVGSITLGETIRMKENCERFQMKTERPSCFFTTGFLNGFFATVKNQHVKETRCIAMGDPYCEWEFR